MAYHMKTAWALLTSLDELGSAPAGPAYAACMAAGITYDQFAGTVSALRDAGALQEDAAHVLTITDKGRAFARALDRMVRDAMAKRATAGAPA